MFYNTKIVLLKAMTSKEIQKILRGLRGSVIQSRLLKMSSMILSLKEVLR